MRKFFIPLLFALALSFFLSLAGCWWNKDKNPVSPIAGEVVSTADMNGPAEVIFKLVLPDVLPPLPAQQPLDVFFPGIRALGNASPSVTFKLFLVNPRNSSNPTTTLSKTVPVNVASGTASASFSGITATTVVGRVDIINGRVGSFTAFRGARDLLPNAVNVLELAPVGSSLREDIIGYLVEKVVGSSSLFLNSPTSLASEAARIVDFLFLSSPTAYQDAERNYVHRNGIPLVEMISPTSGQSFRCGTGLNLVASVSDPDGTIGKVEFFQGVTKLGEDNIPPFSYSWSSSNPGSYSLRAKATDNSSAVGYSLPVEISLIPLRLASPPSGLVASPGSGTVTVSWLPSTGASSYNLYWSLGSFSIKLGGTQIPNAKSPFSHVGLPNGITYFYRVTAVTEDGESQESSQASATPIPGVPGSPQSVQISAGSGSTIISWDDSSGASEYNLYWSLNSNLTKSSGNKIPQVTSPYQHLGLENGKTYYYVVTAKNSSGESIESSKVNATPLPGIPGKPSGFTATPGSGTITLSWGAVAGATSYNLYWGLNSDVSVGSGNKIPGVMSPYTHEDRENGVTYFYIVTAANQGGESIESLIASTTPHPGPPSAPVLQNPQPGSGTLRISWGPVQDATFYNVYWSTSPGVSKTTGTKMVDQASPFDHTGLENGRTYYYVVTSGNQYGESTESGIKSGVPLPDPPLAPTSISVSGTESALLISWEGVVGATSYNLFWSADPGVSISNGFKVSGVTSPYKLTGLNNGTRYYFVISAKNLGGESSGSPENSGIPTPSAPTEPSVIPGSRQGIVSWAPPNTTFVPLSYNLYYSTDENVSTATGTKVSGVTSPYTLQGLQNGQSYFCVITSLAGAQESPPSETFSFSPVLPPPSNVVATGSSLSCIISWNSVPGATGYNLYYSTTPNLGISSMTKIPNVTSPFLHSGLAKFTTFYYAVTALDPSESPGSTQASARTLSWTKLLGTSGSESGAGVAVDASDSLFITGYTTGSFEGFTNSGGNDSIVAKYSASGSKEWVAQMGTSGNEYGRGVAVDSSGNVFVAGDTSGALDGNSYAGGVDMFLTKYSPSGTKQWTKQLGSWKDETVHGVVIDSSGNAIVTGTTTGDFDGNTNSGHEDVFLVKFDNNGNKLWSRQLGASGFEGGQSLAVTLQGYVYIAGLTDGGLDGNSNLGLAGYDVFLAKYGSDGTKLWTKQTGTDSDEASVEVAVDDDGQNIFVSGSTGGQFSGFVNAGNYDRFLVKFDSSGQKKWVKQFGIAGSDYIRDIDIDSFGNCVLSGSPDNVLLKFDTNGVQKLAKPVGISCSGLSVDNSGNIFYTGGTSENLDEIPPFGGSDIFLVKFSSDGTRQ